MRRTSLLLLALILSSTLLTACWDRVEVNDLAYVLATGFDKEEDGTYRVSVQVPLPSSLGGAGSSGGGGGTGEDGPYFVDSGSGRNIRESNDDLQARMSRKLYFAHRRVVIVGEKMAKEGMGEILNTILIQPQSRLSSFIIMSKGEALEVLNLKNRLEQLPGEAIREMAKTSLEMRAHEVLQDIKRPGKEGVIPVIEKSDKQVKGESGQEIKMQSFAILLGDKVNFITNEKESPAVLWLHNRMRGKSITFPYSEEGEITLRIIQDKVTKDFRMVNGKPAFTVKIKATSTLMENEPYISLDDPKIYKKVIKKMEEEITNQVEELLNHAHAEGSDIAGFGWYLYRNHNPTWDEKWKDDWSAHLKDLEVKVEIEGEIQRMTNTGMKVKE
ncbi:spore germination protein KC/spore germination protein [Mesobacillus persicus]|uniref:Spore germination protein KC/spore germination protein n=1 Tax=Mesobacillus persicus TaxID=930146 RepID=A0A1H8ES56_9BACI|nr:Ger(x)C family spore germination protein [Mesobacillus persicus]SEN21707.1 spore germination protein KC/spore germination protein [Mesobacillus persicus]